MRLPGWADPDITRADCLTFEFRWHEKFVKQHVVAAVNKAVNACPGRMGRVQKVSTTGFIKVELWVKVEVEEGGAMGEGEVGDDLPRYESVEMPPAYEEAAEDRGEGMELAGEEDGVAGV